MLDELTSLLEIKDVHFDNFFCNNIDIMTSQFSLFSFGSSSLWGIVELMSICLENCTTNHRLMGKLGQAPLFYNDKEEHKNERNSL
jgi:hypothetical protein